MGNRIDTDEWWHYTLAIIADGKISSRHMTLLAGSHHRTVVKHAKEIAGITGRACKVDTDVAGNIHIVTCKKPEVDIQVHKWLK